MMSRYLERTYIMLDDWLKDSNYETIDNAVCEYDIVSVIFDTWLPDGDGQYDDIYHREANRLIASELFNKYLIPRYYNWGIGYFDGEETEAKKNTIYKHFVYKWWMIMKSTYNKYVPLIKLYQEKEASLLANIKQTGISRYNDTPQDGGDWSDDEHTTNISTTETSTEGATTAVRLAEVRAMWENLYSEWAAEFKGLFIWIGEVNA